MYRSPDNNINQSGIESTVHGVNGARMDSILKYDLDNDEKIEKVSVKSADMTFLSSDYSRFTAKVVTGLQFITTKGRYIPPGILLEDGEIESESFPGYTLGYAIGKTGLVIDQLQFYWYRTAKQ